MPRPSIKSAPKIKPKMVKAKTSKKVKEIFDTEGQLIFEGTVAQ